MAESVFALCALTSLACAALLVRFYLKTRARLLLWSSVGFVGLAGNNVMLFVDVVVCPSTDLSMARTLPAALGIVTLVVALAWEGP